MENFPFRFEVWKLKAVLIVFIYENIILRVIDHRTYMCQSPLNKASILS